MNGRALLVVQFNQFQNERKSHIDNNEEYNEKKQKTTKIAIHVTGNLTS